MKHLGDITQMFQSLIGTLKTLNVGDTVNYIL